MALAISCLVASPAAQAAPPPSYTITDLTPAGATYAIAYGISDDGEVVLHVGRLNPNGGEYYTAYRWENGVLTDLDDIGDPLAGVGSLPRAVNRSGTAVGESAGYPARWIGAGVASLVPIPPVWDGVPGGQAWDVSDAGVVVGQNARMPTRWTDGSKQELALLPDAESGEARAVNESGQVAGAVASVGESDENGVYIPGTEYGKAVRWEADGTLTELPLPTNESYQYGVDIDDAGRVLVSGYPTNYLTDGTSATPVPGLRPGGYVEVHRMNNAGQVVGRAEGLDGQFTPYLYDAGDGSRTDLQSLLPSASGWRLDNAFDINDAGQIVGYGVRDGGLHAFLLSPSSAAPPEDVVVAPVAAGGTVSSNATVSPSDPIGTSVTSPTAGTVSIREGGPVAYGSPASYEILGPSVTISAPSGSLGQPLRLEFRYDASVVPSGLDPATVTVMRNGELVLTCAADGSFPGSAESCLLSATLDAGGDLTVVALTVHASEWSTVVRSVPTWPFAGFFAPVDNGGVVNVVKAGSAVPIKFSLGGDRGLGVIAAGYPRIVKIRCTDGAALDQIEQTVTAGQSALTYDRGSDRYTYVWKSAKKTTGCAILEVALTDGTTHSATFKLT